MPRHYQRPCGLAKNSAALARRACRRRCRRSRARCRTADPVIVAERAREPRARDAGRTPFSVSAAISIGYIEPHSPTRGEGARRHRRDVGIPRSIAFRGGDGFRGAQCIQRNDNKTAQVICPSGCLSTGVSCLISDFPKNISIPTYPKSDLELSHPTPPEGLIMIVTDAGWNAVDAAALARDGIAGQVERPVSDHQASRRTALTRTAKSCGPDAPMLASSSRSLSRPDRA